MIKVADADSFGFDQEPVQQIKVASTGLRGEDRKAFVKRAGHELADWVKKATIPPGEVWLHALAMGAHEASGPNANADTWYAKDLQRDYGSFEKYARLYRHHCFPAGTTVTMADRTRLPIEEVEVGDLVATSSGNQPVLRTMRTDYDGPGARLAISGVPAALTATDDHPLCVLRREQVHCRHNVGRLSPSKHGTECREWRDGFPITPAFVPAGIVQPGDYVLIPIPKPVFGLTQVSRDFARLVGWVASEGHTRSDGSIAFSFAAHNTADVESVRDCLEANGVHPRIFVQKDDGLTGIRANSARVVRELAKYVCGVRSTKTLTNRVLEWDRDNLLAMLESYIEGDGYVARGCHLGALYISSSSSAMLSILSDVIRALDIPATVLRRRPPGPMLSPKNGKTYQGAGLGTVCVNSYYAPKLTTLTRKAKARVRRRKPLCLRFGDFHIARVLRVEAVDLCAPVYNLEVDGPHDYIANEVLVHNCNQDPAKSYGVIHKAYYNPEMLRTELIIGLNATKEAAKRNGGLLADEELEIVDSGKDFPGSMSTKIAYDRCLICGNKAKNRSQYCDESTCSHGGMRKNAGRVGEDGRMVAVSNHGNKFFDWSRVRRPADKTAYVFGKVASAGVLTGAELAENLGLAVPHHVLADGLPTGGMPMRMLSLQPQTKDALTWSQFLKHARKISEIERGLVSGSHGVLAYLPGVYPEIRELDKVAQDDRGAALAALAQGGVLLTPTEWLSLTLGESHEKCANAGTLMCKALPRIFTALLDDVDVADYMKIACNMVSGPNASLCRWAAGCNSGRSLASAESLRRTQLATLRELEYPDIKQASVIPPAAESLAKAYACYQLVFAELQAGDVDRELVLHNLARSA